MFHFQSLSCVIGCDGCYAFFCGRLFTNFKIVWLTLLRVSCAPTLKRACEHFYCPLDLSLSNFTTISSACSTADKGKCCRYINSFVAVSLARYAIATGNLGVSSNLSAICVLNISATLEHNNVPPDVKSFCGLGTKIPVNFNCAGQTTITQMQQYLKVANVTQNCRSPLSEEANCKKCIDASISHFRNLTGPKGNVTLNICRDATFAALASEADNLVAAANCYFGVQWFVLPPVSQPNESSPPHKASPVSLPPLLSLAPEASGSKSNQTHHPLHLSLVLRVAIAVTTVALVMLAVLVFLIHRKSRELEDSENVNVTSSKSLTPLGPTPKALEGPSTFKKFSYKETKKATDNFKTIIGEGGFGTVYKAQFRDGFVAAVKRMNKISEQREDEFCREIQLLARLHHRHLVALRGFCIKNHERFLIYEYMKNGSLKDHLHSSDRHPLSWKTRIQIAINVANALEYLHCYCDPPLCHRDIKSSNILLDENFIAKVADFGLARASTTGSYCFEPVNTDIQGTPGYLDPEYVVTQELTEKSDVYSYGVLVLELVTARHAIQGKRNLVEWSRNYMTSESRLSDLVDPRIRGSFDFNQLQTVVTVVRWCTQRERSARPSIQEVLGLLYESSDPKHYGFVKAVEHEEYGGAEWRGRSNEGKMHDGEEIFQSWDGRGLPHSSSTSRSYCSRSILLESPQSP